MPDEGVPENPEPVISYRQTIPETNVYGRAGAMMVTWSCLMFLSGLPLAALAFVSLGAVFAGEFCPGMMGVAMLGSLAFAFIKSGISLIGASRTFFSREAVNVSRMIRTTFRVEVAAYLAAAGFAALAFATQMPVWAVLAMVGLAVGGGLTYTRITLRRVRLFQFRRASWMLGMSTAREVTQE